MSVHIFGIRHHGPGSAKGVLSALKKLKPNKILVEGPPDSNASIEFLKDKSFKPPIALLVYNPESPQQAMFYPFAEFSPEWQTIHFALENNIPIEFMDLPLKHKLPLLKEEEERKQNLEKQLEEVPIEEETPEEDEIYSDPFQYLAEAAGYKDGESWWEYTFEQREDTSNSFEAIIEAIRELRNTLPDKDSTVEKLREVYMRKVIRDSEPEKNEIAVICGAWHSVALLDLKSTKKQDDALLKKLPKVAIESTWVPWTYGRLTFDSGYGAGIRSPGWYEHIWKVKKNIPASWMTKVARTFRKKGMDVSTAHVIESVRLAEALASMRDLARPGLLELNDSAQSIICFGDSFPMELIRKELIVSEKIGSVSDKVPKVALQKDFELKQKSLEKQKKFSLTADRVELELDIRNDIDLERSQFLNRLYLLGIHWGSKRHASGKGSFKEAWSLQWKPEMEIELIEKAIWGNTVEEAATKYVNHQASTSTSISDLSRLLEASMPAELPNTVPVLVKKLQELAAVSGDVTQLIEALPPLAYVYKYGSTRKTDLNSIGELIDGMVVRTCIGLPNACYSLDDEAAADMLKLFIDMNNAIKQLDNKEYSTLWNNTLKGISQTSNLHGLLLGRVNRLLYYDNRVISAEEVSTSLSLALSNGNDVAYSAYWIEGFLADAGGILETDDALLGIVDSWVANLEKASFQEVLPLVRRAFSSMSPSQRENLANKIATQSGSSSKKKSIVVSSNFDSQRGIKATETMKLILGC